MAYQNRVLPMDEEMSDIWTSEECARYLRVCRKHFMTSIKVKPDFPAPLPWSVRPKWAADQVREWAVLRHTPAKAA